MTSNKEHRPSIRLSCLDDEKCSIFFEPWGTEHVLLKGDFIFVKSEAFSTGDVEVSYVNGGVALTFTADDDIEILHSSGARLSI